MENLAFELCRCVQTFDDCAFGVVARIASGGQHDTQARARVPLCFDLVQRLRQRSFDQQYQARLQAQHDRLGFRVAEAAIELDDFRVARFIDHQTSIEEAGVNVAFIGHAPDGRPDHQVHDTLMNFGGDHRGRGVGTHPAGVRPAVAVADALVVLAGGHGQYILAVDHDNKAGFFAIEKLFDDNARTGVAKGVASQHVTYGVFGFCQAHGDDHALARGQAVGLDDNRRAFFTQIGQGRLDLGEVLIVGGRDLVTRQEVLGKRLGAFKLRSTGGRTEAVQATAAEQVDDACNQRYFGADDGQRNVLFSEIRQLLQCQNVDGHVFAFGLDRRARIARCDKHLLHAWVLGDFPCQGVFTTAAANDQNIQNRLLWSSYKLLATSCK